MKIKPAAYSMAQQISDVYEHDVADQKM